MPHHPEMKCVKDLSEGALCAGLANRASATIVGVNLDDELSTEELCHVSEGVDRERRGFVFCFVIEKKFICCLLDRFPLLFAGFLFDDLAGSGAKFVSGLCAFGFFEISDQAASTAFQSSGTVAERPPNLPVLN